MTDTARVDLLIKYILATAGDEEPGNKELGPIHVLKYVYLADLGYADQHEGETFTAAPWKFHKFGPWSAEVHARITPVAAAVGAQERRYSSTRYEDEAIRWTLDDESIAGELETQIPLEVTSAIKRAIRRYGCDTPSLLHEVYRTRPMLQAAPGELLDFRPPESIADPPADSPGARQSLTSKQAREQKQVLRALRERVRRRLAGAPVIRNLTVSPPPRYDDVYAQGQEWLDVLAGEPVEQGEATVAVHEDVWKSRGRRESGIP